MRRTSKPLLLRTNPFPKTQDRQATLPCHRIRDQAAERPPAAQDAESANDSVIKPKPGERIIKPKDYSDESGYLHPFRRMGAYVSYDQKDLWTSPFHTPRRNTKWWLIFGGATGALIATDKYVARNAPNPHWLRTAGNDVSYLGEPYTLLPISAVFYFMGHRRP